MVYTYDEVTDLFYSGGHPVPPPDFSPESGDAWEDWRLAHDLADNFWERCSVPEDGPYLWRQYHTEPGNVVWHGNSDDAANSEASDLGEDLPPCWVCGWNEPGISHDIWAPENTVCPPHPYEPGNRETGDYVIARARDWDLDGYVVPAEGDDDAVLLARMQRTEHDTEGFCAELARGKAEELAD